MKQENVVPSEKLREKFKELGFSIYMVKAHIGLAQLEVTIRAKRMAKVYSKWHKKPNGNISDLLREIASVCDAVHKLDEAEGK